MKKNELHSLVKIAAHNACRKQALKSLIKSAATDPRFAALRYMNPGLSANDVETDGPFMDVKDDEDKYIRRRARLKMMIMAAVGAVAGAKYGYGKTGPGGNKTLGGIAGGILGGAAGAGAAAITNAGRRYIGIDPLLPTVATAKK